MQRGHELTSRMSAVTCSGVSTIIVAAGRAPILVRLQPATGTA